MYLTLQYMLKLCWVHFNKCMSVFVITMLTIWNKLSKQHIKHSNTMAVRPTHINVIVYLDTSIVYLDTSIVYLDTSIVYLDTSIVYLITSIVYLDTSIFFSPTIRHSHTSAVYISDSQSSFKTYESLFTLTTSLVITCLIHSP